MRSYATISQLADRLRQEIAEEDEPAAQFALDAATAAIDAFLGQSLWLVEDKEFIIDGTNTSTLRIPAMPVVEVTEILFGEDIVDEADYYVDLDRGLVFLTNGGRWGELSDKRYITVTCDIGYDSIPTLVQNVCLSLAARTFTNSSSVRSESIAGYSVTYAETSQSLIPAEMQMIDRWKIEEMA